MNFNFDKHHRLMPKPDKYCPFGRAVRKKLEELNYTPYSFAKDYGISPTYLSHLMLGDSPRSPQIPKIAKALGIKLEELEETENA